MSLLSVWRRRSRAETSMRIFLAAAFAWAGYALVSDALAASIAGRSPERAYALAPNNGRIAGLFAAHLANPQADATTRARADVIAREALQRDATAVSASTTLGLDALVAGDAESARKLLGYSQALSRRDLRTQLWAIEDAVAREDVKSALRQYDITLRTSRQAPALLFPVLSSAITDPEIRMALASTLVMRPAWSDSFIEYAAGSSADPRATAALFAELRRRATPVRPLASTALINSLVNAGFVEDGWEQYRSVNPQADRRRSRDPRFAADTSSPSPFDWQLASEEGVTTSVQQSAQGSILEFSARATIGGLLVRQLQLLPPGQYRLSGQGHEIDERLDARPYLTVMCLTGSELTRIVLPPTTADGGRFAVDLTVPQGCPSQYLALYARPSDDISGSSGSVREIAIRPVK